MKEGEGRPLFLAVPAPIRVHLNLIAPFCFVCHQQDSPVHVLVCVCIHELIELQPPCVFCLDFMIRRSLRFIVCEVCVICNNERVLYVPRGPSRGSMPGVLSSCNCVYSVYQRSSSKCCYPFTDHSTRPCQPESRCLSHFYHFTSLDVMIRSPPRQTSLRHHDGTSGSAASACLRRP